MKRRKSPLKAVFLVLLLLVACAAGVYGYKRYMPTNERADLSRIYDSRDNEVTVFLNYEKQKIRGIYEDGQTYLPVDWVNANLNERFYWDNREKVLCTPCRRKWSRPTPGRPVAEVRTYCWSVEIKCIWRWA